jgi:hypothetical protein
LGKARKITLSTRTFAKAGDATIFFRDMLNRYGIGERVSPQDSADLSALLDRHDEREEKLGDGIVGFEVNYPPADVPQFSERCFWIVRTNDTKIDFSIAHCLERKPYD